MRTRNKLLLAALTAIAAFSLAASSAAANSLSINETEFNAYWDEESERLQLRNEITTPITCNVSLLGHFDENTIAKRRAVIGHVTNGNVYGCDGEDEAEILQESFPWDIAYDSFGGTLPEITRVRLLLIGAEFLIHSGSTGAECLTGTTVEEPAAGFATVDPATGVVDNLDADEMPTIDLNDLSAFGFLCDFASPGSFNGNADVEAKSGGALVIDLI